MVLILWYIAWLSMVFLPASAAYWYFCPLLWRCSSSCQFWRIQVIWLVLPLWWTSPYEKLDCPAAALCQCWSASAALYQPSWLPELFPQTGTGKWQFCWHPIWAVLPKYPFMPSSPLLFARSIRPWWWCHCICWVSRSALLPLLSWIRQYFAVSQFPLSWNCPIIASRVSRVLLCCFGKRHGIFCSGRLP